MFNRGNTYAVLNPQQRANAELFYGLEDLMGLHCSGLCLFSPVCAVFTGQYHCKTQGPNMPWTDFISETPDREKKRGSASPLTAGVRPLTKRTELHGTSWQKDSGSIFFLKGLLNMRWSLDLPHTGSEKKTVLQNCLKLGAGYHKEQWGFTFYGHFNLNSHFKRRVQRKWH